MTDRSCGGGLATEAILRGPTAIEVRRRLASTDRIGFLLEIAVEGGFLADAGSYVVETAVTVQSIN